MNPQPDIFEAGAALRELWRRKFWLIAVPLVSGALGLAMSYLLTPVFTATTSFIPPQQGQNATAAVLASLGSLGNLAAGSGGVRSSSDQYVALMQSAAVSDHIIDHFKLMAVYEKQFRVDARTQLQGNVRIAFNKKDGLITISADDTDPQRAADIANRYVVELRQMTGKLAVTEAQQRRVFFETLLKQSRDALTTAQQALQKSGFDAAALKAEPKAAAESYARIRAEVTNAEVRLQALRGGLRDSAPEVRQQLGTVAALREQLARVERNVTADGPDYVSRYRDYRYQETLFELYARQFELARVDESREGSLVQVIDVATPPERKSRPRRLMIALGVAALAGLATVVLLLVRFWLRRAKSVGQAIA